MNSRRDFLKKVSLVTGGAGIWSQLPPAIQKALAINPASGTSFYDAEYVVMLMQENRSFDHCFGTLQGVRGFNDPRAITLPDKNPVWLQSNKAGQTFTPFRLNIKDTKATWMSSLPHSWTDQVDARNKGKYDGWLEAKQSGNKEYKDIPLTLGYYNREDIPFYYAMADSFTVCDQHFCASLTGTTANRSFFWTGKTRDHKNAIARVRNSDLSYNKEADWKTFPERLEEAGVSWKVYQNEISLQTELEGEDEAWLASFTDNNLEWFSQYKVRFSKAHYSFVQKRVGELPAEIKQLEEQLPQADKKKEQELTKILKYKKEQLTRFRNELVKWTPENFDKLNAFEKSIHERAFTTNSDDPNYHETEVFEYDDNGTQRSTRLPKGDILHQFRKDVDNGQLPTVSWLVAPENFSDHPSAPWYGAWYVSEVLDILTKNPEVWKKTIFVLTYDENDGYFDHVPPFVAPKPNDTASGKVSTGIDTTEEYVTLEEELSRKNFDPADARESPVGLGYRVPLIIASPWTRGGWVNSEVCDITSILQFLEKFLSKKTGKAINETNISDWRRTISGDLTSVFRPYDGEKINFPEPVKQDAWVKEIYNAKFKELPAYKALTKEEVKQVQSDPVHHALLPPQEKGIRDSCALPYELYAEGKLSKDKKNFEIELQAANNVFGLNAAGSPFNIYAPGKYAAYDTDAAAPYEAVRTWAYAVRAGDKLKDQWPLQNFENGKYHLRVYGPNGFFREFSGDKNDPAINITLKYETVKGNAAKLSGNIILKLEHTGRNEKYSVEIVDKSYGGGIRTVRLDKAGAMATELIRLDKNFNWYDIAVKIKGNQLFEKRYAGRVETGRSGKTDPLMARIVTGVHDKK